MFVQSEPCSTAADRMQRCTAVTSVQELLLEVNTRYAPVYRLGHEYILISSYLGYIHYTPQLSRTKYAYRDSFLSVCSFFSARHLPITQVIMDNEKSDLLDDLFTCSCIKILRLSMSPWGIIAQTLPNGRSVPVKTTLSLPLQLAISPFPPIYGTSYSQLSSSPLIACARGSRSLPVPHTTACMVALPISMPIPSIL